MGELTRYNRGLWNAFDSIFNEMDSFLTSPDEGAGQGLRIHVDESDEAYELKAEMPGLLEDQVNVNMENDLLSITAEYSEESSNSFRRGKYRRTFSLPNDVDTDNIKASMERGILKIELPKSERSKPRKIEISRE